MSASADVRAIPALVLAAPEAVVSTGHEHSGSRFYAEIVESLGSDDGREVACALDALRGQGKLSRDRDGRYQLVAAPPGSTGIIGELYHDPNEGT